ncbi:MAG: hypothetical protein OXC99_05035 [Chloroflexi bacterium]|nr:hypothetical protein [Chloroflexota bacterium]
METLEFRLRVPVKPDLDSAARLALLDEGTLTEMPSHIAQGLLPRDDMGSLFVFRVMLQDTGIFITEDWVVRIVGRRILDCVYALCALMSLIIVSFDTSVSVDLITLRNKSENPLHRLLFRKSLIASVKGSLWWIAVTLLAAAISGWIGATVFGG